MGYVGEVHNVALVTDSRLITLNFWRTGKEEAGVRLTLIRIVLALTTVQLLNFYVNQFSAIGNALAQFGLLVLLLTYRQWYLDSDSVSVTQVDEHLLGHDTS